MTSKPISSAENQKGLITIQMMFRWELEGYCRCTKSVVIAPFCFSMEHCWIALTPVWFSAEDNEELESSALLKSKPDVKEFHVKSNCACVGNQHQSRIDQNKFNIYCSWWYRQLRARRALLQIKDVPLRTRRALLLYKVFRWEPEGRYCCTKSMAIAPFWLSTEHLWTAITPFWVSTDDMSSTCVHVWTMYFLCKTSFLNIIGLYK